MNLILNYEKKLSYIYFKAKGKYFEGEESKILDQFIQKCKEYNCYRLLLNCEDVDFNVRTMNNFIIGTKIAEKCGKPGEMIKIACVRGSKLTDYFIETVAVNRGASFRIFSDENEAIEWLLED